MDFQWKFILCCTVILLSNMEGLHCLILHLYQRKDFVGLHQEYELKPKDETVCLNFPNDSVNVESVRTDECVILYVDKNCTTPKSFVPMGLSGPAEWSRRFDKDTAEIPSYRNRTRFPYSSFHVCSQAHGGGAQLDLDIYDGSQPGNSLIMKYRGVCNCRNIPASISTNPNIYVDMHGNKVEMFSEENCEGTSYQLGPQDNLDNRFLQDTIQFSPRSFKPVELDNCYRLHADIYKFHFRNGTINMGNNTSKTKFDWRTDDSVKYNFESTPVLRGFYLATPIPDKVLFSVTVPITKLQSAVVKPGFEVSTEGKFRMITNEDIKSELEETYKWSRGQGYNHTNTTTIRTFQRIVRASIPEEVPPCSFCRITPDIERAKNVPMSYDLYAYIRGSDPAENLTAIEIRQNLPAGMTYIRDHDEHTVEVKTNGTMFGDLAIDVIYKKRCAPIPSCTQKDDKPEME